MTAPILTHITNVLVLDDQHAVFFDCIRRLEAAMATGKGALLVPPILEELSQFVEFHFATEERLMESFQYPLRDMHGVEHQKARLRLREVVGRQDDIGIALKVLDELKEWLENHILKWDGRLGVFLNERGVT